MLEIDGASNRRIDDIRLLRSNVGVKPMRAKYKVYIIDEVHMLTNEAFNALLKTLEEPPGHTIIFMVAESERALLDTVRSRLRLVRFAPLEVGDIEEALAFYGRLFRFELRGKQPADDGRHFGLVVDDKDAARRALRDAGVTTLDGGFLDFRDPWGNRNCRI